MDRCRIHVIAGHSQNSFFEALVGAYNWAFCVHSICQRQRATLRRRYNWKTIIFMKGYSTLLSRSHWLDICLQLCCISRSVQYDLTLCLLNPVWWLPLQTVWTQIRSGILSGLILIKTLTLRKKFLKNQIFKKSAKNKKACKISRHAKS